MVADNEAARAADQCKWLMQSLMSCNSPNDVLCAVHAAMNGIEFSLKSTPCDAIPTT